MNAIIATLLLGAAPISEIRGAVIYGIGVGLEPWLAYVLGLIGNLLPVIPLLLFLDRVSTMLSRRFVAMHRFFEWLFTRVRHKHSAHFERWGLLGLLIFVAIPLPMTGVWSGAAAAFLFGFRRFPAFIMLTLGAAIAGGIILATIQTGTHILR